MTTQSLASSQGRPAGRPITLVLDPRSPDPEAFLQAATMIRQGGIVAHPTETTYGLAADPFDEAAVRRLYDLKGRAASRAMILLIAQMGEAYDVARVSGVAREWFEDLARLLWPGPLTMVLPSRPRLRCPALGGGGTVAVRVSSHPIARQIVRTAGRPITSTSANLSGRPPATSVPEMEAALAERVDLILDAGPAPGGPPSTVLDLTGARPSILRQGGVTADQIAAVLGFRPRSVAAAQLNLQ